MTRVYALVLATAACGSSDGGAGVTRCGPNAIVTSGGASTVVQPPVSSGGVGAGGTNGTGGVPARVVDSGIPMATDAVAEAAPVVKPLPEAAPLPPPWQPPLGCAVNVAASTMCGGAPYVYVACTPGLPNPSAPGCTFRGGPGCCSPAGPIGFCCWGGP